MRSKLSRTKATWAAIAASGILLAGCSTGSGDQAVSENDGDQASNPTSETSTITVWHYSTDDSQLQILEDYKVIFESEYEGVEVENVYVPYDQMLPKLATAGSSSTGPDVVVYNSGDTPTLAFGGTLAPLDEQWAGYADADQYPSSLQRSLDGNLYAVQGYVNLLGLWYNSEILEELGVEPPATLDELDSALQTSVDAGYGGITLTGIPNGQAEWQAYPWLTAFGWDYANPQRQPLVDAYGLIADWVDSGKLSAEAVTWDQTVPMQEFVAGGIAFAENGNWQSGEAANANFQTGVVPLPVGADGGVYLGGEAVAVGAFAQNPEMAWNYMKSTYLSAEGQLIAMRGVGSIPARADVASDPEVASNPVISAFAETVANSGAAYPSGVIPAEVAQELALEAGAIWSSVIAGTLSPEEAADAKLELVERLW